MRVAIAIVALLVACAGHSAEFGLGASFDSDEGTIFLPVRLGEKGMLEPYFRFRDSESRTGSTEFSSEDYEFGIGLFRKWQAIEQLDVYLGLRAAYVRRDQASAALSGVVVAPGFFTSIESTLDGYLVAPTVGFEYKLIERLTIGAEVAVEREDLSGDSGAINGQRISIDSEKTDTRTNVIIRFYF